jgi:cell division transport system permease protein
LNALAHLKSLWTLHAFRADIPLSRDEASRFLPWIIALMVYMAALTLVGSFTLHSTIATAHTAQVESFSVHVPRMADNNQETADKVLALIKHTPGVADASITSIKRVREMVEPWLGKSAALDSLPLPTIIEAKLTGGASIDYTQLKSRINTIAPGSDIDDHKQWLEAFTSYVHMVQLALLAVSFFIVAATAAMVIFACKTSLKIHRGTVNLLHRLGALDSYIAAQFQQHAALLALKGAFVGSGFAAGTLLGLHLMAQHIDSPLFPSFTLNFEHWAILFVLPAFMSALALAAARMSVLSALHKMP